jgi:DNA helicase MCM8
MSLCLSSAENINTLAALWRVHFPFDGPLLSPTITVSKLQEYNTSLSQRVMTDFGSTAGSAPTSSTSSALPYIHRTRIHYVNSLLKTLHYVFDPTASFSQETPHSQHTEHNAPVPKHAMLSLQHSFTHPTSPAHPNVPTVTIHYPSFSEAVRCNAQLSGGNSSTEPFLSFLHTSPREAIPLLCIATGFIIRHLKPTSYSLQVHPVFNIHLSDVKPCLSLKDITSNTQGNFISVKGHILKVSAPRLLCKVCTFVCTKCPQQIEWHFKDGIFSQPKSCCGEECRSRTFVMVAGEDSVYEHYQRISLQEEDGDDNAGQVPRTIVVECKRDLVNSAKAGDCAMISGIVESMNSDHFDNKGGKKSLKNSLFVLYLEANCVQTIGEVDTGNSGTNKSTATASTHLTTPQLNMIKRVAYADPGPPLPSVERNAFPFDLLVHSLCPDIFGHEISKAGLLLTLFGGTPVEVESLDPNATRSNIHILIVGDPGMGKSMMLRRVSEVADRSVFVGGNTSTTSGLTVSVVREGSDTTLEAGALVLADQGLCCIDEFDKMQCDDAALLECMEQQSISVAKSGICTTLPARCSVVAAANPKQGRYNPNKSVAENLSMKTPLLSRFDLCFILQDKSDDGHDARLASHVMKHHRQEEDEGMPPPLRRPPAVAGEQKDGIWKMDNSQWSQGATEGTGLEKASNLVQRLKKVAAQQNPLPMEVVKNYIQYSRQFCRPKLKREAAEVLRDYFMKMKYSNTHEGIPITTRQLEAMVRLAQARAKACLREWVTREDAEDVTDLMSLSIIQTLSDAGGNLDTSRRGSHGTSKMGKKRALVDLLKRLLSEGRPNYFAEADVIALKDQLQLTIFSLRDALEEMREQSVLIKKKGDDGVTYWIVTE